MKLVPINLDDDVAEALERLYRSSRIAGDRFANEALRAALSRSDVAVLEQRHREGYEAKPVAPEEFDWESEQVWGDEDP